MSDDARFTAAMNRYFIEPEAITDDDISTMAEVDDLLATKAATRRADARRDLRGDSASCRDGPGASSRQTAMS